MLVLGALCGAAGFAAEAGGSPSVTLQRPSSYRPVSTMQMLDTMGRKKAIIDWTCYVDHINDAAGVPQPSSRITAWLEGKLKREPGDTDGIEFWDIGAQHRTSYLMIRIVTNKPFVLVKHWFDPAKPDEIQAKVPGADGFFLIEPAQPVNGVRKFDYLVKSKDKSIKLEVYYPMHPPGPEFPNPLPPAMHMFQTEDGGPPALPPVNEN